MEQRKLNFVYIFGAVVLAILISSWYQHYPSVVIPSTIDTSSNFDNGKTLSTDKNCSQAILAQEQAVNNDPLANAETFEKYPVTNSLQMAPADLDIKSNSFAYEFRGVLMDKLSRVGVNFAGHYSIVYVGMTGWGANYFIVDRSNGKTYIFPYIATFLDFNKDSNLIRMNSKEDVLAWINEDVPDACMSTGTVGVYYTDARPFYFLWQNNELQQLGPGSSTPPMNPFWTEFK
ncbi:hypothetical protein A3I46_03830 [Candidatus Kaiserbacteria bacterium RIFCSPLOWO2_02_FULL_54_13]|uniref:Uncharacterized protein n=1 Tax=Candidatus Kaiserbacteria bacterium RIFCSPHIGHO2_02_FULL_54_22 TaxID=1798495 RepID=A0A1F6DK25_9BACT|nr:MAG: hypothetical protein A3C19_01405 [Candidatus Kaiserbacteria bacterium RIFCSPHIGHO2_02_FULL_54_22]OGG67813.1 MAG: hypothetical protein A3E99_01475 [Candidatus Kaiserbacteria bacterium RIFCSPHIGHO2_12_FULL_54_16]OGG82418.1 MAG: hypothetical protein A3I46_03830 [Candidatus Kaiserbacteria bacterium RIFCSPLOWO2_02_FULL_54_13]